MLKKLFFVTFIFLTGFTFSQFDKNQTPTYPNLVNYFDSLKQNGKIELFNMGQSDYGLSIYLCILNGELDSIKTVQKIKKSTNIFINNGIHPGEPDGINACAILTKDFINGNIKIEKDVTFSFFLCYNVDGMMVRSSTSRANQNGPEEYGFRGNSQNLDLNRDFIKMDSENAFTFVKTFHFLHPSIFVDTHVSNGADYQYILTLIHAIKERLEPAIKEITFQSFVPDLNLAMKKHQIDLIPYVDLIGETPEKGIQVFNDLPRYAMGYASLFPCISITTETHMLKSFPERVNATKLYLKELINWTNTNYKKVEFAKKEAYKTLLEKKNFAYSYKLSDIKDSILFKGFEHGYKKSEITDLDRLFYDRNQPYERFVPFYKTYHALDSSKIPNFYVVASQCKSVIERLKQNEVEFQIVGRDSIVDLTFFRVKDYKNGFKPYEGHYLHHSMQIDEERGGIVLKKGDVLIPTQQKAKQFICTVLEPEAEDSFFAWNFFDSYLQEKEYFSDYVFEDIAMELFKTNPKIKLLLDEKKKTDAKFAQNQWDQLYFIYQQSPYFEPSYMRLPVYKIY